MESLKTRIKDGRIEVGDEVIKLILALPKIQASLEALTFNIYSPYPGLEERLARPDESSFDETDGAGKCRNTTFNDIPFLESIFTSLSINEELLGSFVQEAIRHDSVREFSNRFEIPVHRLSKEQLQKQIDKLSNNCVLALCSKCKLRDGTEGHIPMMDFRCVPSSENLRIIKIILRGLGQKNGAIVESGRSYHFYGFELLDENEWIRFLARCLLLHPFTDARYIAHRLMGGACALRITATALKPKVPIVLDVI